MLILAFFLPRKGVLEATSRVQKLLDGAPSVSSSSRLVQMQIFHTSDMLVAQNA